MLVGVAILFAVFAGTRYAIVRTTRNSTIANVAAAAIVFAFILGSVAQTFRIPTAAEDKSAPVALATAVPGSASVAPTGDGSKDCRAGVNASAGGVGSIDFLAPENDQNQQVADGGTIERGAANVAVGWAADVSKLRGARAVCLVSDGRVVVGVRTAYGSSRPDVAKAYDQPDLTQTGFEITIPPRTLALGKHRFAVAVESSDGAFAVSRNAISVNVR